MLQIYFGDRYSKDVYNFVDTGFGSIMKRDWLLCDFAKRVVETIDKSKILGDQVIWNEYFGARSFEFLSGGVKTLLAAYYLPDEVFPLRNLGDNCTPFLLEIAEKRDTKWFTYGYLPEGLNNVSIAFPDIGTIIKSDDIQYWLVQHIPDTDELHNGIYTR